MRWCAGYEEGGGSSGGGDGHDQKAGLRLGLPPGCLNKISTTPLGALSAASNVNPPQPGAAPQIASACATVKFSGGWKSAPGSAPLETVHWLSAEEELASASAVKAAKAVPTATPSKMRDVMADVACAVPGAHRG